MIRQRLTRYRCESVMTFRGSLETTSITVPLNQGLKSERFSLINLEILLIHSNIDLWVSHSKFSFNEKFVLKSCRQTFEFKYWHIFNPFLFQSLEKLVSEASFFPLHFFFAKKNHKPMSCILLINTSWSVHRCPWNFLANVTLRVPMGSLKKVLPICMQVGQYVRQGRDTLLHFSPISCLKHECDQLLCFSNQIYWKVLALRYLEEKN